MSTETYEGKTSFNEPVFRHVKSLSILRQGANNTLKAILIPPPPGKLPSLHKRQSSLIRANCDLQERLSNSSRSRSSLYGDNQRRCPKCALRPNGTWAHVPFEWMEMLTSIIDVINTAIKENDIQIIYQLQKSQKELYSKLVDALPSYVNKRLSKAQDRKVSHVEQCIMNITSFADNVANRIGVPGQEAEIPQIEQWYRSRASKFYPYTAEKKIGSLNDLLECMMSLPSSSQRSVRILSENTDKKRNHLSDDDKSDSLSLTPLIPYSKKVENTKEFNQLLDSTFEFDTPVEELEPNDTDDGDLDESDYSEFNIKFVSPLLHGNSDLKSEEDIFNISDNLELEKDIVRSSIVKLENMLIKESVVSLESIDLDLADIRPLSSSLFHKIFSVDMDRKSVNYKKSYKDYTPTSQNTNLKSDVFEIYSDEISDNLSEKRSVKSHSINLRTSILKSEMQDGKHKVSPIGMKANSVRQDVKRISIVLHKSDKNSKITANYKKSRSNEEIVANETKQKEIKSETKETESKLTKNDRSKSKETDKSKSKENDRSKSKETDKSKSKENISRKSKVEIAMKKPHEEKVKSKPKKRYEVTKTSVDHLKTLEIIEKMKTNGVSMTSKLKRDNGKTNLVNDKVKKTHTKTCTRRPFSVLRDCSNSVSYNDIILLKSINKYDPTARSNTSLSSKPRYKIKSKAYNLTENVKDLKQKSQILKSKSEVKKSKYYHLLYPKIVHIPVKEILVT